MIIGIDASKAAAVTKTGVENYVYQLLLHLKKIDGKNTYYLFTNKSLPQELVGGNFIQKILPGKFLWNKIFLPIGILKNQPEIFFAPAYNLPAFTPPKSAATFHDLAWIKFPKSYSLSQHINQRLYMRSLNRAKVVFTVSRSAAEDLKRYFGTPKFKIITIPIAGNSFNNLLEPKDVLNLKKTPYFLSVGRLEERKNTYNTVKAFEILRGRGVGAKLVLAGKPGYGYEKIAEAIKNSQYKSDIIRPGYLPQEHMNDLFSGATAIVYPSLYEGFGLTAHEAMLAGTPVITSNVSSLPEVVGDAGLLIDPTKPEEIADAMEKVIKDRSLRDDLVKKGLSQAKRFSWEKTALETLNALESL